MGASEIESSADKYSTDATSNGEIGKSANPWENWACPLRGPQFPFGSKSKAVFRQYFKRRLHVDEITFNSHFKGSDKERSHAERYLKAQLPQVVARDAWRKIWSRLHYRIIGLAVILVVILCIAMPWLVADYGRRYNIWATVVGLAGMLMLLFLLVAISQLWKPLGSNAAFFVAGAVSAGATTWLFERQPSGWVFWSTALAAFSLLAVGSICLNIVTIILPIALLRRTKITRYLHAELSESVLRILDSLSTEPPNFTAVASDAYYIAKIIEQHWQRVLTMQNSDAAVQQRVRVAVVGVASGMREIGLSATFPPRISNSGESFESKMVSTMAKQLTALTTFRYGDLIVAQPTEVAVQSWLWKALRNIRSVIAAIAPITLLLVIPKVFNLTVSPGLNSTLLTISLGWLALYIIGWLDPKALINVSSMADVTNLFKLHKPGS
jgi:hypothetical protein